MPEKKDSIKAALAAKFMNLSWFQIAQILFWGGGILTLISTNLQVWFDVRDNWKAVEDIVESREIDQQRLEWCVSEVKRHHPPTGAPFLPADLLPDHGEESDGTD